MSDIAKEFTKYLESKVQSPDEGTVIFWQNAAFTILLLHWIIGAFYLIFLTNVNVNKVDANANFF